MEHNLSPVSQNTHKKFKTCPPKLQSGKHSTRKSKPIQTEKPQYQTNKRNNSALNTKNQNHISKQSYK